MGHKEEIDTYPEIPAVQDPRWSGGFMARARRKVFGDPAAEAGLWYPQATKKFAMRTKGNYEHGFPIGVVVHSTEGRSKRGDIDTENTISGGVGEGYCYFGISSTGRIYQSFLLDRWGSHCGVTWHRELGFNLANKLVGIEVSCAGVVKKHGDHYKPDDWNESFGESEVRFSEKVENVTQAGFYHLFTPVQEQALFDLVMWMRATRPDVFKLENVLGHDEIATVGSQGSSGQHTLGRKQDPGASLSTYMKAFRAKLQAAVPSA